MSDTYEAAAIIGVRIPASKFTRVPSKTCAHELPAEAKYCPTCGRKAYDGTVLQVPKPLQLGHWQNENENIRAFFDGYDCYYGLVVTTCSGFNFLPVSIDLQRISDLCRDVLEPLGLWEPTTFGLWTVLSYDRY